jgi:uroporphyrinogen-III synthase
VVTRDTNQAKSLIQQLTTHGAEVIRFPTIEITDPDDPEKIREVLRNISNFDWIIFTSTNAVKYFYRFVDQNRKLIQQVKIACVGKKTAETLAEFSLKPTLIPERYTSLDLLKELEEIDVEGKHILLPTSNIARNDLERGLLVRGAQVQRIEVYKNIPYSNPQSELLYKKINNDSVNCITFYSPSALNAFIRLMGDEVVSLINAKQIAIAVIGPTTAQAAREKNLAPSIQPSQSDDQNFVEELIKYYKGK